MANIEKCYAWKCIGTILECSDCGGELDNENLGVCPHCNEILKEVEYNEDRDTYEHF